jgi:hypothetical protein
MTEKIEEIIDVEQYAKEGKIIPHSPRYRIRIDKIQYVVDQPSMTGYDLLNLAGKTPPDRFALYKKLHGGRAQKIELDEVTDFRAPGVERFMTLPLDQTEGGIPAKIHPTPRSHFELPVEDIEFLESMGLVWETVSEGSTHCVVIYGYYNIPDGYNQKTADLHVRIDRTYLDTQIDMVYFSPPLSRKDGKSIKAISDHSFDGRVWQRWSRHRTTLNPWRIGIDNIETHITLIGEWLFKSSTRHDYEINFIDSRTTP